MDGALEQAQYLELRMGEKKGIKEMEKRRREMGTTPQPPPHSLLGHFTPMQSLLGTYRIFFGFFLVSEILQYKISRSLKSLGILRNIYSFILSGP